MKESEIRAEVLSLISQTVGGGDVTEQTHLIRELGMSSVEIVLLLSELEDRIGVRVPAGVLRGIQTAGDLCRTVLALCAEKQN